MKKSAETLELDVLLATYNGEKFLPEMLNSLVNQKNVNVNLIVGDDGSNDRTLEILNDYRSQFHSFELHRSDHVGSTQNFIGLLSRAKSEVIAFADQDDVWDQNKLVESARILEGVSDQKQAALYVCATRDLHSTNLLKPINYKFPLDFYTNRTQGCTFVMNKKLADLALASFDTRIKFHDWFVFLLAKYFGNVVVDKTPRMSYRLHQSNSVGSGGLKGAFRVIWNTKDREVRAFGIKNQMEVFQVLFSRYRYKDLEKSILYNLELFSDFRYLNYLKATKVGNLVNHPIKVLYFGTLISIFSKNKCLLSREKLERESSKPHD
jgi:glycosyltransferase involved in cell wall biosynthesis